LFIELEEGIDGLVHVSDLSWTKKIKHPSEFVNVNEELEVQVLELDVDNRRLALGHKQLEENPWDVFETVFSVGSVHKGSVIVVNDKGAVVTLPYGVEGFAPKRHLQREDGANVAVDMEMEFKVIEFSKDSKKIILSHSNIWKEVAAGEKAKENATKKAAAKATGKAMKNVNQNVEKTTLGDLGVLGNLKAELQKDEKAKAKKFMKKMDSKEEAKSEDKAAE
jgi:small subunit ribosomal protein S1